MKTKRAILLVFALLCAIVSFAQPSTRIDLTQLIGPPDPALMHFIVTNADTAYYEVDVMSIDSVGRVFTIVVGNDTIRFEDQTGNGSSLWSNGATSGEIYYNSGNVGIGLTDPRELLDVDGGDIRLESSNDPGLRIYSDDGAETSYLDIRDYADNYAAIQKVNSDNFIDGFLDIDVLPQNNTAAIIRMFRNTNTTDVTKLEIFKGNNTSTRVHRFATITEPSFVNVTNATSGFGVGTQNPSRELDVFGDARLRGYLLLDPQGANPSDTDEGILFYDNVDNRFSGYSEAAYRDLAWVSDIDSTRIVEDSIAVYYSGGSETGRDTIRVTADSQVFEVASSVVRTTAASTGQDFVFGSSSLDDNGTAAENERFFFDNSKGYFFAGVATTDTTVNDADRGFWAINQGYDNSARAANSAIGGGVGNLVTSFGTSAKIGGGEGNLASNLGAVIGGGIDNESGGPGLAYCATVGGGQRNTALERFATTSGGIDNINSAQYGTIGGGRDNDLATDAPDFSTIGGGLGSRGHLYGSWQHSSGNFDVGEVGQAQNMQITVRREGTGINDYDLYPSGNNTSVEHIEIPNNTFWSFTANCVTVVTDIGTSVSLEQGDSRAQTIFGKAENDTGTIRVDFASPALTSFDDPDGDLTGFGITLSADAVNNALQVTCSPPDIAGGGTLTTDTRAVCTFLITQLKY